MYMYIKHVLFFIISSMPADNDMKFKHEHMRTCRHDQDKNVSVEHPIAARHGKRLLANEMMKVCLVFEFNLF